MAKTLEQHYQTIAAVITKLGETVRSLRELERALTEMAKPVKIPAPLLPLAPSPPVPKAAKAAKKPAEEKPSTFFRDALVANGAAALSVSEAPRDIAELSKLGRGQLLQLGEQLRLFGANKKEMKGVSYSWIVNTIYHELKRLDQPVGAPVPPSPAAGIKVDAAKAHIRPHGDGRLRLTTPDGRTFVQKRLRDLKLLSKKLGFEWEVLP